MNNEILEDGDVVYYVVKVNGNEVSPRYSSPMLAEAQIEHLSEAHRAVAEVVPITASGDQLLLG